MSKTYNGVIYQDDNDIVLRKKTKTSGDKRPDFVIKANKIDNEEIKLPKITKEFVQTLTETRKNLQLTQKDLALKSGLSLSIIQSYEKVDHIVDLQFQNNCNKIKKALNLLVLPKI